MACCEEQVRVGTVSLDFIITIVENCTTAVDISASTDIDIIFTKPDGSNLTKIGSFVTDGTDGKVRYTTIAGDLEQIGLWKIQAIVNIGSSVYPSSIYTFKVYGNLI